MGVDLVWFNSEAERSEAVGRLRALGPVARRLLAQTVESTGIRRRRAADSALKLESEGFVLIREVGFMGTEGVDIVPTLWGEEALEVLDDEADGLKESGPGPRS